MGQLISVFRRTLSLYLCYEFHELFVLENRRKSSPKNKENDEAVTAYPAAVFSTKKRQEVVRAKLDRNQLVIFTFSPAARGLANSSSDCGKIDLRRPTTLPRTS